MSDIDPNVLEFARREYGENCELVKRTEWSYSFKCGAKCYGSISRFMIEKGFSVSASEIRQRWPAMDERERLDFASNFHNKGTWTENDTEILEIIMADGSDLVWSSCAQAISKHADRNRAIDFLTERVQHWADTRHPPLNYMQALAMLGDRRAVAVIQPYYDEYRKRMEAEKEIAVPDDVFTGPIPYHAFLAMCGDLFKITGAKEYEDAARKYFDHPKEQVRWRAEYALGIEGPTTQKRNTEYKKKRESR